MDKSFKHIPLMGHICSLLDSIYINRDAAKADAFANKEIKVENFIKSSSLDSIIERQELIEKTGKYAPLVVFAEGATTNNTALLKFKKGAFVAGKRCLPILMEWKVGTVHPAYDTIPLMALVVL